MRPQLLHVFQQDAHAFFIAFWCDGSEDSRSLVEGEDAVVIIVS